MSKSALDEEESSDDEVNTVNVAEGEKKRRPGKRKVSSNKTPHPTLYENEDYSKPTRPELNMLLGSPESNVSIAGKSFCIILHHMRRPYRPSPMQSPHPGTPINL